MKKLKDSEIDATLYSSNFNGNCCCVVLIPCGVSWNNGTKGYLYAKIKMVKTFPINDMPKTKLGIKP